MEKTTITKGNYSVRHIDAESTQVVQVIKLDTVQTIYNLN